MKSIIFYLFSTTLYRPCSGKENNIPKKEEAQLGQGGVSHGLNPFFSVGLHVGIVVRYDWGFL